MADLLVVLIILGCAAYLYLKGTLVNSFVAIISAICASMIAFGYFEVLAGVFTNYNSRYPNLVPWAQPLSFLLLFILGFATLRTIAGQLTREEIDFGIIPERIGCVVCGIFLGLIISGLVLTTLAMAPLPNKYPYQRFDTNRPNSEKPKKVLLNADGFATGLFSMVSKGSFSGKRSFATLHPAFLDQVFLNRHNTADGVSILARPKTIKVLKKDAFRLAPEGLRNSSGENMPPKSGHNLTIVRVGITTSTAFTPSQLRLVSRQKGAAKTPLEGKGKNIDPVGYLKTKEKLQIKQLNDRISIERDDFTNGERWIDFAFYVPTDSEPVLLEFKQNSIVQIPPDRTAEPHLPAVPFIPVSECAKDAAELEPISSAKVYGTQLAAGAKFLADLTLKIEDTNQWQSAETTRSIKPAQFVQGKITCVRAELKTEKPAEAPTQPIYRSRRRPRVPEKLKGVPAMFKALEGYELLSLKCNSPSTGAPIRASRLPVLVELAGQIHHPVGVIASAEAGDQMIYEVDYCSLTDEQIEDGLVISEDGSVAQPFPDTVWLTEQAQNISEFYVLYLVESGRNAIIESIQPAEQQKPARLKKYSGFLVK